MRFILLVSLALIAGCGNSNTSGKSKPKDQPTRQPIQYRPLEMTQRETVRFTRRTQMVSRYNCDGKIISRKNETQNSLSKKITVNYDYNPRAFWGFSVLNRRTNSSSRGVAVGIGKFVVDYAPTVFNMRVKEGINDIEYVFTRCSKIVTNDRNEKVCQGQISVEKEGLIQLDVYYMAETIPGEQHLHPTPESCKQAN